MTSATVSESAADMMNILSGPGLSGSFMLAEYSLLSIWMLAPFFPKVIQRLICKRKVEISPHKNSSPFYYVIIRATKAKIVFPVL